MYKEAVNKETNEHTAEVLVLAEVVAQLLEPSVETNLVVDEFCCNAEYTENILSEGNSLRNRFIIKEDLEVFKRKTLLSLMWTF